MRLGALTERRWSERDFVDDAFPEVAAGSLRELVPHQHIDPEEAMQWFLEAPATSLPEQRDRDAWAPLMTVRAYPGFYISLYAWFDATTEIHNHAFAGAFCVLSGASEHTRFDFEDPRTLSPYLRLGELRMRTRERLQPGAVRRILPGDGLIHTLDHLRRPSLTVIVRTETSARHGPEYRFLPPGIAVHADFFRHADAGVVARKVQLAEARDDAPAVLLELMRGWDSATNICVLTTLVAARIRRLATDRTEARRLLAPFAELIDPEHRARVVAALEVE